MTYRNYVKITSVSPGIAEKLMTKLTEHIAKQMSRLIRGVNAFSTEGRLQVKTFMSYFYFF